MTPFTRAALPALVIGGAAGALLVGLDRPSSPGDTLSTVQDMATTATTAGTTTEATATTVAPAETSPANSADSTSCSTVEGPVVDTRFGPVQVAASVSADGTICDVEVLQYPSDDPRSSSINQRAVPVLIEATLEAQSADVDTVSGATYTSVAYQGSLQAILDSLGG